MGTGDVRAMWGGVAVLNWEHAKFYGHLFLSMTLAVCACWGVAYAAVKLAEAVASTYAGWVR